MARSPVEPQVKRVLMSMLKRGVIDVRQAAEIGCVSRQAVAQWVAKEGWDVEARRAAFALREFSKAMNVGRRVASKRELRKEADEASKLWEWRRDTMRSVDVAETGPRQSRAAARGL